MSDPTSDDIQAVTHGIASLVAFWTALNGVPEGKRERTAVASVGTLAAEVLEGAVNPEAAFRTILTAVLTAGAARGLYVEGVDHGSAAPSQARH